MDMSGNIYEIKHSYIFDMEHDLKVLEAQLCKVKNPPKGLYVNGNRFPYTHNEHGLYVHPLSVKLNLDTELPNDIGLNIIDSKGNLIVSGYNLVNKRSFFSTKPFHPVLISDFLHLLVDYIQYNNCPNKELFFINTLIGIEDSMLNDIVKSMTFLEDVIYYCFVGIDNTTMRNITDFIYKRIFPIINEYMAGDINAYYSLDLTKKDIVINKHNDIRAIRYMLAMDKVNFDMQLNKEYEENI